MVHVSAWIAFLPVGLLLNFKAAAREMKKTILILPVKFVLLPIVMWLFCYVTMDDPVMIATLVIFLDDLYLCVCGGGVSGAGGHLSLKETFKKGVPE